MRGAFAGMCASLVGIGLARFAYTPLIPVLIAAAWFTPGEAAYLGAANLAGYLAGALLAARLALQIAPAHLLRAMMVLIGVSFFACAEPWGFAWFTVWRGTAGFAGGVIMALAAPVVLAHTPPSRRGRVGGLILTGVGLGVIAAGTLVPALLRGGVPATGIGLGVASLVLTALCWRAWPPAPPPAPVRVTARSTASWMLAVQYGFCAVGLVPHMVFLVDFVVRGLGHGLGAGAVFFLIYAAGATAGPLFAGFMCDRIGFRRTLHLALPVQTLAVGLPLLSVADISLGLSSFVAGMFTPGIVSIVLGRAQEIAGGDPVRHRAIWGAATASFALFQAVAAYGLAYLFSRSSDSYTPLFAAGVVALVLASLIGLVPIRQPDPIRQPNGPASAGPPRA